MIEAGFIIFMVLFIVGFCLLPFCCRKRRLYLQQQLQMRNINRVQEVVVNGQRVIRVATVSRTHGQVSLDVYEIRLDSQNGGASSALPSYEDTPPPPFQTALQESTPVVRHTDSEEMPPPSYDDFMKVHNPSVQDNSVANTENDTGNTNTAIDSNDSATQRY